MITNSLTASRRTPRSPTERRLPVRRVPPLERPREVARGRRQDVSTSRRRRRKSSMRRCRITSEETATVLRPTALLNPMLRPRPTAILAWSMRCCKKEYRALSGHDVGPARFRTRCSSSGHCSSQRRRGEAAELFTSKLYYGDWVFLRFRSGCA